MRKPITRERKNNKTIHKGGYLKQPIKAEMFRLPQFRKHTLVISYERIRSSFSSRTLSVAPRYNSLVLYN
jgi:hypothetical protein